MVEMQVLEITLEMNERQLYTYGVLASVIVHTSSLSHPIISPNET